MGITTAAGPGLNLLAGLLVTGLVWRVTKPVGLALLLWGPVALIQEGVNLSLGLLSPGSDAQWLVTWGAPDALLITLGVTFILAGVGLISWILHRTGFLVGKRFPVRIALLFFGLGFLMILRAVVSLFQSPGAALENAIPLLFALILSGLISGLIGTWRSFERDKVPSLQIPAWGNSLLGVGLGFGILLLQIILP
jgi:hypothetical protein